MTDTPGPLESRLRSISSELCAAIGRALFEALGRAGTAESIRPVELTSKLGLNKSLASRVVRALREEDPLRALQDMPTPQGLQLIEQASRDREATAATLERLIAATSSYGELLGEFSGGRAGLHSTLSGWIPDQRVRAERDARRTIFRGMTALAGTLTGTTYSALYLMPSEVSATSLESVLVNVRQDLRRLRPGVPVRPLTIYADEGSEDWRWQRCGLDGEPLDADPRKIVMRDLFDDPQIELVNEAQGNGSASLIIPESALDINEVATVGFAWRSKSHYQRFATQASAHGELGVVALGPMEGVTLDLFLHKNVEIVGVPFASLVLQRPAMSLDPLEPPQELSPERQLAPTVVDLRSRIGGLACDEVRNCQRIAEETCAQAGLDLDDFRTYRVQLEFPILHEKLALWWKLPPKS